MDGYVRMFVNHFHSLIEKGSSKDIIDLINHFDKHGNIQKSIKALNPSIARYFISSLFMEIMVKTTGELKAEFPHNPWFAEKHDFADRMYKQYGTQFFANAIQSPTQVFDMFKNFTNTDSGSIGGVGSGDVSQEAFEERILNIDMDKARKSGKFTEEMIATFQAVHDKKDAEVKMQYAKFKGFMKCIHKEMCVDPNKFLQLQNHDESLFKYNKKDPSKSYSFLQPANFLWKVSPDLDPLEYPQHAADALLEIKINDAKRRKRAIEEATAALPPGTELDVSKVDTKELLPTLWASANNMALISTFDETLNDADIQVVLDYMNNLVSDFMEGKIEDFRTIPNRVVADLSRDLPVLESIWADLQFIFFELIFHNFPSLKLKLSEFKNKIPDSYIKLAEEWKVNVNYDKFNTLFEDQVQGLVTQRQLRVQKANGTYTPNGSTDSKTDAPPANNKSSGNSLLDSYNLLSGLKSVLSFEVPPSTQS